jgi:hypothetical protein
MPGPGGHVNYEPLKVHNTIDVVRLTVHPGMQMSRAANARKPKSIIAFVAPFTHR